MITGASTGVGRHAAEYLANRGFHVLATVRKTSDMDAINAMGVSSLTSILLDVTSSVSINQAVESIVDITNKLGLPLVALVNNAGVVTREYPVESMEETEMRRVMETNFFGMFAITKALLPRIRQNKGRIIMISSLLGTFTMQLCSAYSASKHALEAFSDALRIEVRNAGVSVSIIEPGMVKSSIIDNAKANVNEISNIDPIYHHMIESSNTYATQAMKDAETPIVTSIAIYDALTNRHPRTRYLPTKHGLFAIIIACLPDRVRDALFASM